MKAKKLPSGSWRCRVYSGKDANGKKHQESFTAPTKAEAEMLAAQYAANKKRRARHDLTVAEAIDGYIEAKEGVLSPGTIRGYVRYKGYFEKVKDKRIRYLTSEELQLWISDLAKTRSPKTVKNAYSLLTASIGLYSPNLSFKVTLPARQKNRPESPTDATIKALFENAQPALKVCIGLGICGLREGEVSALKHEDIKDGVAHIHAVFVKDRYSNWIYKELPKTEGSDRFIILPGFALDLIGEGEGFVTNLNPATISKKFTQLRDKLGYKTRFHDLRHYFASTAAVLGIPDIYTADMGGWERNSSVMKSVYQNNIKSMSEYYAKKINNHLDKIIG